MIQGRGVRRARVGLAAWVALVGLTLVWPLAAHAQVLIGETSARFDWQAATGDVGFYEVYVSRSTRDGHYALEQTVPGSVTSAVIDAGVGEVVRVRVRAGNDTAFGPMSAPSDSVRFGLPPELPVLGSPGVLSGRVGGAENGSIFYANPDTGQVLRFSGLEAGVTPTVIGTEPDTSWTLAVSGDFDGDGAADLFWRRSDGSTRIWYLDGDTYQEEAGPTDPGPTFTAEITGDFDGNGQDDVFWRDAAGPTLGWFRVETEFQTASFPPMPPATWELLAAGDFDGDGYDDLLWRNLTTTDTAVWLIGIDPYNGIYARARSATKRSLLWEVYETFDEDGDGYADIHWRVKDSPDIAEWWHMQGETVRAE